MAQDQMVSSESRSPGNRHDRHQRNYNFKHFLTKHVLIDLWKTAKAEGIQPGEEAPDFQLETTSGETVRLSALRGRPVLLRFGNFT